MDYDYAIFLYLSYEMPPNELEEKIIEIKNINVLAGLRDYSISFKDPTVCSETYGTSMFEMKLRKPNENDYYPKANYVLALRTFSETQPPKARMNRLEQFAADLYRNLPYAESVQIHDAKGNRLGYVGFKVDWVDLPNRE